MQPYLNFFFFFFLVQWSTQHVTVPSRLTPDRRDQRSVPVPQSYLVDPPSHVLDSPDLSPIGSRHSRYSIHPSVHLSYETTFLLTGEKVFFYSPMNCIWQKFVHRVNERMIRHQTLVESYFLVVKSKISKICSTFYQKHSVTSTTPTKVETFGFIQEKSFEK